MNKFDIILDDNSFIIKNGKQELVYVIETKQRVDLNPCCSADAIEVVLSQYQTILYLYICTKHFKTPQHVANVSAIQPISINPFYFPFPTIISCPICQYPITLSKAFCEPCKSQIINKLQKSIITQLIK